MRIVKLKGGLGNQMFQYAFAKNIESLTHEKVLLDASAYKGRRLDSVRKLRISNMDISLKFADQTSLNRLCIFNHVGDFLRLSYKIRVLLEVILNKKYYFEWSRKYVASEKLLQYCYYDGYWQAWENVKAVEGILRNEFKPRENMNPAADKVCRQMAQENAVFVGIRRGDYLAGKRNRKHYGEYQEDYYLRGMAYIEAKLEDPIFYIFTNDKDWVRQNMLFEGRQVRYMDDNLKDFEELMVMSRCSHAIMNNSTFYWWGAWLIENPGKMVIVPRNWFADGKEIEIVPDEWIRL